MWRLIVAILVLLPGSTHNLRSTTESVHVRIADVGAGLCCIITLPDADDDGEPEYVIYDGGNGSVQTFEQINDLIPLEADIQLLVISHSDGDHLAAIPGICSAYHVKKVLRTGFARTTDAWINANSAIENEVANDGCTDINLSVYAYPRGATFRFGDAFIQFVAGWNDAPESFEVGTNRDDREYRNSISIVVRLMYDGKSVLFTGDTIGREIDGPLDQHKAAEREMVDWNPAIPLKSDVIVAPHHGADNASSMQFIQAVDPEFVVFSAGNLHDHPRGEVAARYRDHGIPEDNIFRTDRGSTVGGKEWLDGHHGHMDMGGDISGDDDVDVFLHKEGDVEVRFLRP